MVRIPPQFPIRTSSPYIGEFPSFANENSAPLTGAGLVSLKELKYLKTLLLSTKVPESAIAGLRRTLPGVKILQ
jgi:hypothetical protein